MRREKSWNKPIKWNWLKQSAGWGATVDMWMTEITRQWRMEKRCRSCWIESEKRARWEKENANLPLFIRKCCVSTTCTSAKTGFRWNRQEKTYCPWTKKEKRGLKSQVERGQDQNIHIDGKACLQWATVLTLIQGTVHSTLMMRCWKLPQRQSRADLSCFYIAV